MLIQNKQVSSLSSKNPRWPQDLQVKPYEMTVSETIRLPAHSVIVEDEVYGWRGNYQLLDKSVGQLSVAETFTS